MIMRLISRMYLRLRAYRRRRNFTRGYREVEKRRQPELQENLVFNGSGVKKRCFIIGNGPSINDLDFSRFAKEDVFTMNQISRNPRFAQLKPNYHFWADPYFFTEDENHGVGISNDLLNNMLQVARCNKEIKCIATAPPGNGVIRELAKETKVYSYVSFGGMESYSNQGALGLDHPGPGFNNVMQYAIYSALCMGYQSIYLLGSEQTSLLTVLETKLDGYAHTENYGYIVNPAESDRMIKNYQRSSVSVFLHEHAKMFDDFDRLNQMAIRQGSRIYLCTEKSLIDCFPFISLEEVFGG